MLNLLILEYRLLYAQGLAELFRKLRLFSKIKYTDKIENCIDLLKQDKTISVILISRIKQNRNFPCFIREIKNIFPSIKILMLYDPQESFYRENFLSSLIDGYISVEWTLLEIKNAFLYLQKEGKIFPRSIFSSFISKFCNNEQYDSFDIFTQKELSILDMLCRGKINKEIAISLGIKEKTVKNHLHRIYIKLGVKKRTEAVLKVTTLGII